MILSINILQEERRTFSPSNTGRMANKFMRKNRKKIMIEKRNKNIINLFQKKAKVTFLLLLCLAFGIFSIACDSSNAKKEENSNSVSDSSTSKEIDDMDENDMDENDMGEDDTDEDDTDVESDEEETEEESNIIPLKVVERKASDYADAKKPSMSLEDYPRIDGSLACVPLCEKLAIEITGCNQNEAEQTMANFTNTNPSYLELAQGNNDIILAYEPANETAEELKKYSYKNTLPLELKPIGKDALVFIVNADNPVDSLTKEQICDIYSGKIKNWKEVGGNDEEIKAFQRPETSGSQTLMRKLLMGEDGMIDPIIEEVDSMDGIIQKIKSYDNSANAIGFSVFYYASEMFHQPNLKFIKVDGVMPSNDTIQSEKYTLVNEFYSITTKKSSDEAKQIQNWLLSDEGQAFVETCGYVSVK